MELLQQAVRFNDFGLRKRFPWSDRLAGDTMRARIDSDNITPDERVHLYNRLGTQIRTIKENDFVGRIENPYLWSRYVLRYEEMRADPISTNVQEHIVIHATSISAAYEIADNNFDWRLVRRYKYGQGVSFARDVDYAARQATQRDAYIVAGILVATSKLGGYNTQIPSVNFDTTTNHQKTVFVKYYDSDFYPYYIVH